MAPLQLESDLGSSGRGMHPLPNEVVEIRDGPCADQSIVWNLDVERRLESQGQLDKVERIYAEIVAEQGSGRHLGNRQAELYRDELADLIARAFEGDLRLHRFLRTDLRYGHSCAIAVLTCAA